MRWDRFKPRRAARPVVFLWACAVILLGLGTTSAQTPQMKVNELRLPCSVTWGNVRFAINESGDVANLREAEKPLMSLITLHVHAKGWRGIRDFRPGQVHFADQAWGREVKVQGTLVHEGREFPCVKTLSLRHEGAVGFTYEVRPHSDVELEPIYGMVVLPISAYRGETARMDGMDVVYPAEPEKSVFHEDRMNARHVVLGAKAAEHRLSLISHTGWAQLIDQRVKPWNAQNYSLHFWGHRWVSFTLHFREVPPQDVPVQSALLPLGAKIPCDFSDGLWACTVDKNGDLKNLLLRQQTLLVGSRFGLHAKGWKSPDRVHYDAPVMRPADFGVEVHTSGKMTFGAVEVPFQRILRIHREGKIEFEANLHPPEGFGREQAYMQLDLPLDEYRGESALVDGQEVTYPHEPRQDYPRSGAFWTGKARELRLGKAKKHSLNLSFPTPTTVNLIDHRVPLWGNSKTYDVHVWENESGRIRFALALPSGVRRNELREFMGVPERRPRWELPKPLEGCERVKHVDLGAGATEGFASDDALVSLDGGWWRPMAAATAKARFADLSPDRSYVVRFRMARARGGVDYLDMCRISPSGVVMANGKYIGSYGSASWTSPPESYRYQLPAEIVAADGSLEISFHQPDLIRARNSLFPWVAIEEGKLPEPPRFSPKPLTSKLRLAKNGKYFVNPEGKGVFLLGQSVYQLGPWCKAVTLSKDELYQEVEKLARYGMNFTKSQMLFAAQFCPAPGQYDPKILQWFDWQVEACQKNGVAFDLNLICNGALPEINYWWNPKWLNFATPGEFFTSRKVLDWQKELFKFLVERYRGEPCLLAFNSCSEPNIHAALDLSDPAYKPLYAEFLKQRGASDSPEQRALFQRKIMGDYHREMGEHIKKLAPGCYTISEMVFGESPERTARFLGRLAELDIVGNKVWPAARIAVAVKYDDMGKPVIDTEFPADTPEGLYQSFLSALIAGAAGIITWHNTADYISDPISLESFARARWVADQLDFARLDPIKPRVGVLLDEEQVCREPKFLSKRVLSLAHQLWDGGIGFSFVDKTDSTSQAKCKVLLDPANDEPLPSRGVNRVQSNAPWSQALEAANGAVVWLKGKPGSHRVQVEDLVPGNYSVKWLDPRLSRVVKEEVTAVERGMPVSLTTVSDVKEIVVVLQALGDVPR